MHESALETALRKVASPRHRAPGECLDEIASARFATGEMGPAERAEACEHLSACSSCLDRIAVLVELEREDTVSDSIAAIDSIVAAPTTTPRTPQLRSRVGLALAASLVLALFAGLLLRADLLPGAGDSRYREIRSAAAPAAVPVMRSPLDGHELRRSELQFEWTSLDSGIFYDVELLSGAGDILWQDRTEGTVSTPPDSLYLEPGAVLYVWVRAQLNDGKTVKSPTVSFRVLREK